MLQVGLTGGIGSGKSTIAKIFSTLGIPVYDADNAAKNIMQTNEFVRQKLIQTFGESVFMGGVLNKAYLSEIVFSDKSKIETLNAIVHPAVVQDAENWFKRMSYCSYAIKEAALIFESGSNHHLDFVIGVWAPQPLRINRVVERGGMTEEQVLERISKQMDEEKKMSLCNFVIDNSGNTPLIPQVIALHEKFLELK